MATRLLQLTSSAVRPSAGLSSEGRVALRLPNCSVCLRLFPIAPSLLTGCHHPKGRYFSSLTSLSESAEALEAVSFEGKFATSFPVAVAEA